MGGLEGLYGPHPLIDPLADRLTDVYQHRSLLHFTRITHYKN